MKPAEVKSVGNTAKDVGTTDVSTAAKKLGTAEDDKATAKLHGFESNSGLDSVLDLYIQKTKGLAGCLEIVGGKLIDSAEIYISTDNASGDLFELKDAYAETR